MYVTAQALYVTTGKYANPSIRCGATVSVILPVMPDILDIVIVLQHINELLHILRRTGSGYRPSYGALRIQCDVLLQPLLPLHRNGFR